MCVIHIVCGIEKNESEDKTKNEAQPKNTHITIIEVLIYNKLKMFIV